MEGMHDFLVSKSDALALAHRVVRESGIAQYAAFWPARRCWTVDSRKPSLHPGFNNVILVDESHREKFA